MAPFLVSRTLLSEAGAVPWLSSQRGICTTDCQLQQEQALLTALPHPQSASPCATPPGKLQLLGVEELLLLKLPSPAGRLSNSYVAITRGSQSSGWSLEMNSPLLYSL